MRALISADAVRAAGAGEGATLPALRPDGEIQVRGREAALEVFTFAEEPAARAANA